MPELTVSMPAYNTERFIGEAIEGVLRQTGIDFELLVVDDGSQDDTGKVALSFKDPRVKVFRNSRNRGISFCHNRVISESASAFIAHVDSDDLVLPHALNRMVTKLKSDPRIGQVHCYFFDIDEDGKVMREAFRRKQFLKNRPPDMDYKRELLIQGTIINHLRTYRRQVFAKVGYFNEQIRFGEDYEMALRIIDKFTIKLVPEFLYCLRLHQNSTTKRVGYTSLRFFLQRLSMCRELLKTNQVNFLKEKKYNPNKLLMKSLYNILRDLAFDYRSELKAALSPTG
jgi:glycosyltransferase involved in cell wall biosynthesis